MTKQVFFSNESDTPVYVKLYAFAIMEENAAITLTCNFYISLNLLPDGTLVKPNDIFALEVEKDVKLGYNITETAPGFAIKKENAIDDSEDIFLTLIQVSNVSLNNGANNDSNLPN